MFAQGNRLKYTDNIGNSVKLRLRGPGYLEQILDASGEGVSLNARGHGPAPHDPEREHQVPQAAAAARPSWARSRGWGSSAT